MKLSYLFIVSFSAVTVSAAEPITIKLWPKGAEEPAGFQAKPMEEKASEKDGLKRTQNVSDPTITVYRPEKPNGTAVIVAPGGGYGGLAIEHEGTMVCDRSEEHTSELQSQSNLVCRLLLEKKKRQNKPQDRP